MIGGCCLGGSRLTGGSSEGLTGSFLDCGTASGRLGLPGPGQAGRHAPCCVLQEASHSLAYSGLCLWLSVSSALFGAGNHTSTSFPEVMPSGFWVKRTGLFLLLWFPESGIAPPATPTRPYMRPR